ncbi:peptidase [Tenacibaculum sp. E3R01]|uniref:M90 family metallopeptidase n=1 Tax=Tenacibaculum sp. E3R01 TaxID=2267227 RepID=UPI000DEAC936|nr:zinc-dependent peptidase [Tenacibaculum sp. E3R01]RBW61928.1 peptidase [Tenacibaculum sp. E3R01]
MIFSIIIISLIGYLIVTVNNKKHIQINISKLPFKKAWEIILIKNVAFYNALSNNEKKIFQYKIQEFLLNCNVIGVNTVVNDVDKVLIASSAIIPIFNFPEWKYPNISEVILYPTIFNENFQTKGPNRNILGMVGNGYLEGKMILSKPALHLSFQNESDKKNTAIHEFIHLIDKLDGTIDGIPKVLLEKQYIIPWIDLMNKKMGEIYTKTSDINPYGGTNRAEFFSVASEYFFERPKLLAKKHPQLYYLLEKIFKQDMDDMNLHIKQDIIVKRNSPCPCNSGLKYKKCCISA